MPGFCAAQLVCSRLVSVVIVLCLWFLSCVCGYCVVFMVIVLCLAIVLYLWLVSCVCGCYSVSVVTVLCL